MSRARSRQLDLAESYYLLLELTCCEPIIQQGFAILENVCLAHGLAATIDGTPVKREFQRHLDRHWLPFLGAAIRAMHVYGFVPWRLKRLPSGDRVPEVLPAGSFRWGIEVPQDSDAMLAYTVKLNPGQRDVKDIHVREWIAPNFQVSENSIMYATVASPMSYVIESYKHMQAAVKRQVCNSRGCCG